MRSAAKTSTLGGFGVAPEGGAEEREGDGLAQLAMHGPHGAVGTQPKGCGCSWSELYR
jgi:hypothetical protein